MDQLPQEILRWLSANSHGRPIGSRSTGGGCINNGAILSTTSGATFFLKTNPNAPADMFAREVEGLEALGIPEGPKIPKPYLYSRDYLLMEDLRPARRATDYWEQFGRQLAFVHRSEADAFGFPHDNYIGSTPQPNGRLPDGFQFFAERRLIFQARLAKSRGLLSRSDLKSVEELAGRLPSLVPSQPASLIHGDLWSGNATSDHTGSPAIIDPAAHYGWAEADLAMTDLFGSFPGSFYEAYQQVRPLDPGYKDRYPIYNLYHLLNHLNLFGGSYLAQAQAILRRFG